MVVFTVMCLQHHKLGELQAAAAQINFPRCNDTLIEFEPEIEKMVAQRCLSLRTRMFFILSLTATFIIYQRSIILHLTEQLL